MATTYDLIGRMTDLVHTADTTEIANYHWDYDAFSRITFFSFAFSAGDDGSSEFDYDATGQLIAADHTAQTDEEFEFDENGNRTMSGYVTGDNNLVLSDGEFDYLYDAEGNRIRRTRISNDPANDHRVEYEWDHRNRLSAVFFKNNENAFTAIILYEYDVFNRRTRKIIDRDGVGEQLAEQIDFIYDGQNIILALDGEGSLANRYLHGPGVDQILTDEQVGGAGVLWTLTDNQGSVRDLANNSGAVQSHIDYTAFGRVETETQPAVRTLYGWTGRERDTETGLNGHRGRYYDPVLARWISEDPKGFAAGDRNLERLTHNDPVNFVDPDGREEKRGWFSSFLDNVKDFFAGATKPYSGRQGQGDRFQEMMDRADRGEIGAIRPGGSLRDDFEENKETFEADAELGVAVVETGARTVCEPLDQVMTAVEVARDPTNPGNIIGAAPIVPGGMKNAGAVIKKAIQRGAARAGHATDAARGLDRTIPDEASRALARAPAPDNYRGRYNAARHAQGKSRLPDDWDAHHRIPQEYRDHPEFSEFDFHDPSNIQGVKGNRADVNTHQAITNEWAAFRAANPNATRREIDCFASQIDQRYSEHWFQ